MRLVMDFTVEENRIGIKECYLDSREQAERFAHGLRTLINELWPMDILPPAEPRNDPDDQS